MKHGTDKNEVVIKTAQMLCNLGVCTVVDCSICGKVEETGTPIRCNHCLEHIYTTDCHPDIEKCPYCEKIIDRQQYTKKCWFGGCMLPTDHFIRSRKCKCHKETCSLYISEGTCHIHHV